MVQPEHITPVMLPGSWGVSGLNQTHTYLGDPVGENRSPNSLPPLQPELLWSLLYCFQYVLMALCLRSPQIPSSPMTQFKHLPAKPLQPTSIGSRRASFSLSCPLILPQRGLGLLPGSARPVARVSTRVLCVVASPLPALLHPGRATSFLFWPPHHDIFPSAQSL